MDQVRRKRYTWAVYLFLLAFAIVLALIGINYLADPVQGLVLSLSTELAGVVLIFFVVNQLFLLNRDEEIIEEIRALGTSRGDTLHILVPEEKRREFFSLDQHLAGAVTVDLLGYGLPSLLGNVRTGLVDKICAGTQVRILLVDIESDAGKLMRLHTNNEGIVNALTETGYGYVRDILARVKLLADVRGSVEFRLTSWIPSCHMIIVNRDREDGVALVGINPPSYRPPNFGRRLLILRRAEHLSDFDYFVSQFNSLWKDDSYPYEQSRIVLSKME